MNRCCSILASAVVAAASVLALGACGGGPGPTATVTAPPTTVTAVPTPTETPTAEPAVVDTPTAVEAPETFTMPKLVGENLQLAQDILQKEGSFVLDQEDALGLDRIQVNDSNWQVCKQSPKAGKKVAVDAIVTLSSVKLSEDCP